MYISWVTRTEENRKFLEVLVNHENVKLFNNKNLRNIIEYLRSIAYPYFLYWVFLPFLCLGYLPVHLVALTDLFIEFPVIKAILDIIGCILLLTYFIFKTMSEFKEILQKGRSYLRDWYNYVEIFV